MAVAEIFIFILIVVGVVALTAVLFGGWLIVKVIGLVGQGIASLVGLPPAHRPPLPGPPTLRCPRAKCHAPNAPAAKFCRRCGTSMTGEALAARARPNNRRAAMW